MLFNRANSMLPFLSEDVMKVSGLLCTKLQRFSFRCQAQTMGREYTRAPARGKTEFSVVNKIRHE